MTLAKDHAFTFVDHALRHGDSLVGLSKKQIEAFHWKANASSFQAGIESMKVREHVQRVSELRQLIREADDNVSDQDLRNLWDKAQIELSKVRLFGDLTIAAFFEGDNFTAFSSIIKTSKHISQFATNQSIIFSFLVVVNYHKPLLFHTLSYNLFLLSTP